MYLLFWDSLYIWRPETCFRWKTFQWMRIYRSSWMKHCLMAYFRKLWWNWCTGKCIHSFVRWFRFNFQTYSFLCLWTGFEWRHSAEFATRSTKYERQIRQNNLLLSQRNEIFGCCHCWYVLSAGITLQWTIYFRHFHRPFWLFQKPYENTLLLQQQVEYVLKTMSSLTQKFIFLKEPASKFPYGRFIMTGDIFLIQKNLTHTVFLVITNILWRTVHTCLLVTDLEIVWVSHPNTVLLVILSSFPVPLDLMKAKPTFTFHFLGIKAAYYLSECKISRLRHSSSWELSWKNGALWNHNTILILKIEFSMMIIEELFVIEFWFLLVLFLLSLHSCKKFFISAKRFAEVILKRAVAEIILKYDIKPCAKTAIPIKFMKGSKVLMSENGIWVKIIRRKTWFSSSNSH